MILTDLLQLDDNDKFVAGCWQVDNFENVCGIFGCMTYETCAKIGLVVNRSRQPREVALDKTSRKIGQIVSLIQTLPSYVLLFHYYSADHSLNVLSKELDAIYSPSKQKSNS